MEIPEATHPSLGNEESALANKLEEARQNLVHLNERAMAFAREKPIPCLVGAVALGFIVGKIASRY
jgi:hypothetical protein